MRKIFTKENSSC